MAKLPDPFAMGPTPQRAPHPMAHIDASPIAAGAESAGRAVMRSGVEMGQTVERIGDAEAQGIRQATAAEGGAVIRGGDAMADAIRRGAVMEERGFAQLGEGMQQFAKGLHDYAKADLDLDLPKAKADFISGKILLNAEFSKDTEAATVRERYQKRLDELRDRAAATVRMPNTREKFLAEIGDDYAKGIAAIDGHAFKLESSARLADLNGKLEKLDKSARIATEEERAGIIDEGTRLIDGANRAADLTPLEAFKLKRDWVNRYAKSSLISMDPERRERELSIGPQSMDEYADRTIGVESGGKATAKNSKSSAFGPAQFIDSTWLGLIRKERPDLAAGRSDADLLALRADPRLSKEMAVAYGRQNAAYLKDQGIDPTYDRLYLAHFLGPKDAAAVIKASPDTPVAGLVSAASIKANPSVLGGKTAGTVVAWSQEKMGTAGPTGRMVDFLTEPERLAMLSQTRTELAQIRTAQSTERATQYTRSIIDAGAGVGALPERSAIEADPALTEERRNALLSAHDKAVGDIAYFQRAFARFQDPKGGVFDPFDKDERGAVDKIYAGLGSNAAALQRVVDRTGMVPDTVAASLRADIASNSAERVAGAATIARNVLAQNPTAFTGAKDSDKIETAAVSLAHYVDDLGMTAQQAAAKLIEQNTPEYQAQVKARIKNEDLDKIVKDKLKPSDLGSAFNEGLPLIGRPSVEFNPEMRAAAMSSYVELFRERYLEHGDVDLAKKQAAEQLKKAWGVSYVTGSVGGVFMRYPPEKAPAYANIPDASSRIAVQAVESIKAETGQDVDRKKIILSPTPGGQTAMAYKSGEPVPYTLSWFDKSGVLHTLNPGRAFVPDPKVLREETTAKRAVQFNRASQAREYEEAAYGTDRLPFGVASPAGR